MDATPSVHFNFEDTSVKRTPWMQGLSKEHLSFGLSATSQHPQQSKNKHNPSRAVSPYERVRVGEWMKQEERLLARSILNEIENAESPARQHIHRLKTDEFFEQFDRVFEVKFDSPTKPNQSGGELQQSTTQPLQQSSLVKDFSNKRHPQIKISPVADRKTESCSLGQTKDPKVLKRSTQRSVKAILRRKQRGECKPATTSHTYRTGTFKDLATNCNRTVHQLSVVSVEAKDRKDLYQRIHQVPTVKRTSKPARMEVDELHTVFSKCHPTRDMFLRSGTLENWKRKFNERRMRSRETDLTRTVKIRSLGCKRRKPQPEPVKIMDFHILRKLRA